MFGGAAGFIGQFAIFEGGKQQTLMTDASWEAKPPKGAWGQAAELHPNGAGPWGGVMNVETAKIRPQGRGPTPPVRAALVKNDFLMRSLGRPHRDQVVTTRPAELTTLQAIDLANGDVLAQYLNKGARNLVGAGRSSGELIPWLYRYALSREPTPDEQTVLADIAGDGNDPVAVEDLLWLVFMQPEFQIVR
ncbi:MAG: DUF1553 domain-containing protein [Verrucomicrobiota bacterium]